MNDRYQR
jgi:chromosome segregation ATPase